MSRFVKITAIALAMAAATASFAQAEPDLLNAIRTGTVITPHGIWDAR